MSATKSWTISDEFWEKIEPYIPSHEREKGREYHRKPGAGRKPLDKRQVLAGILYVLRNGCLWAAVPAEYGAKSSIHKYFQEWRKAGVFVKMWQAGLIEYDELEGIDWEWQSLDGAMGKAPLAQESVGRNPTDRGKNGHKKKCVS